jgi:hypothetical protein
MLRMGNRLTLHPFQGGAQLTVVNRLIRSDLLIFEDHGFLARLTIVNHFEVLVMPLNIADRLRRSEGRSGRIKVIGFKVNKAEHAQMESAAKCQGMSVSEWARDILLREAGRGVPERAIFTELIALRQQVAAVFAHVAVGKTMTREVYEKLNADLRRSKHRTAREVLEQYTITGEE